MYPPWQRSPASKVVDLVRVEVSAEGREELHPLISPALPIHKHQQGLLVLAQYVRLETRGCEKRGSSSGSLLRHVLISRYYSTLVYIYTIKTLYSI